MTVFREIPFSAIQFPIYEELKISWAKMQGTKQVENFPRKHQSFTAPPRARAHTHENTHTPTHAAPTNGKYFIFKKGELGSERDVRVGGRGRGGGRHLPVGCDQNAPHARERQKPQAVSLFFF